VGEWWIHYHAQLSLSKSIFKFNMDTHKAKFYGIAVLFVPNMYLSLAKRSICVWRL
jgi:hypothetical protein